ncbi:MAG: hypothetical protein ACFFD2_24730 [Promethearchaeota archaeon]
MKAILRYKSKNIEKIYKNVKYDGIEFIILSDIFGLISPEEKIAIQLTTLSPWYFKILNSMSFDRF